MEFKHDRRTNTAYIKTVDLQLNGEQINLSERPNSKDQVIARKKLVRSLRPCTLRRPMSATPSFGYRDGQKVKRMPPWSRPQSAGGSSSLRRNKLAAKFSQSTLHDPDYCAEFGATYTLSSSQLLHSLMGSCSINEGLDSLTTPTPSPQPTLGDTIRVAAQLEPGLTAKPPLPPTPTPTPQQRPEPPTEDDIIALKFQRWFPDAILESEIIRQASIVERQMDETDQSDAGTSLTDRTTFSDKQTNEKPSTTNISTFVKKRRIPKSSTSEDSKKSIVKFSENKVEDGEGIHGMKSPKIVVHEVDPYGCDLVTEEFVSESNIRCLTPDYISSLNHSSLGKDKNNKCLSLSDLNVNMSHSVTKSHSASVYSDSEMYKDVERNLKSSMSDKSGKGYSNHEIYQNDEQYVKTAVSEYTDKIYEDDKPNSKAAGLKKPENSMSRELYKDDECNIKSTASEKSGKRYSNHKMHKDNEQYVKTAVSEYSDNKYLDHEMYEEDIPSNKPTGSKKIERSLNPELNTDERSISSMSGKYGKGHSYHEMNGEEEEHNVKSERFHKEYSGRGVCKDDKHIDSPVLSKRIHRGYSDSEMCKSGKQNVKSKLSESSCISDSELYKDIERSNRKSLRRSSDPRYEIGSPENFETSASKYRHTSTPIGNASNKQSSDDNIEVKDETSVTNTVIAVDNGLHGSMLKHCNNIEVKHAEHFQNYNSLSPPIRLRSEEEELYRDHLSSLRSLVEKDQKVKTFRLTEVDSEDRNDCDNQGKDETKIQEKHAHFTNESKPFNRSTEVKRNHETVNSTEKCLDERKQSYAQPEKNFSTMKEKIDTHYPPKVRIRHGSLENVNKDIGCKSNKPVKEIYRAASVPPYPNTKPAAPLSKHAPSQDGPSDSQNSKRKVRRSMSYDEASIPELSEKDSGVSSYEDIVTMIKVLEREDLQSPVIKYKATPPPIENLIPEQSSSAKAILNFLDEVERGSVTVVETDRSLATAVDTSSMVSKDPPVSSRLGSLLTTDTADLAQQVMTLTLQLEESLALSKALEERYRQSVELLRQQKTESDEIDSRRQKFIDQLLKEKRLLAVQYETALREMEGKHETAMKVIEERHKVEMRKAQEKFNAAEKIRRDKWIDTKTKKIKELTVRGLEPELERMAAAHQEELAELRRVHQRQMTEAENAWARRTAALREQEANERQAAIQHEREAARHRMEQELGEIEKSYQEQRRRLMEEVRQEKDLLQRQSERLIAEKQVELAKQMDEAKKKLQTKLAGYDKQHEEELAKLKECLETEKQAWITRQKGSLEEREAVLREELKRERDKHIELVIRRLESEAAAKEQAIENKLKRLKESYDAEVNDLDSTLKELRARLKETRSELQKSEDNNAALKAQISQAHNELMPLKQTIDKLRKDYNEAKQQSESKIAELQREISETKQAFQEQVTKIHNEKEKQLQQVYTRVKEAISKKEEALTLVSKQRDLALEQCSQLEKMLEAKRNHSLKHL